MPPCMVTPIPNPELMPCLKVQFWWPRTYYKPEPVSVLIIIFYSHKRYTFFFKTYLSFSSWAFTPNLILYIELLIPSNVLVLLWVWQPISSSSHSRADNPPWTERARAPTGLEIKVMPSLSSALAVILKTVVDAQNVLNSAIQLVYNKHWILNNVC